MFHRLGMHMLADVLRCRTCNLVVVRMSADKASNGLSEQDRKAVQEVVRDLLPAGALFVMSKYELFWLVAFATFVGVGLDRVYGLICRMAFKMFGV